MDERKLLVEFVEWSGGYYGDGEHVTEEDIAAFLAARQPQAMSNAEARSLAAAAGVTVPGVNAPLAPQRFWRVLRMVSGVDGRTVEYRCYVVGEDGMMELPFVPFDHRAIEEDAKADGRSSGLPEWPGGK